MRSLAMLAVLGLAGVVAPALATDFGAPKDVKQVRSVVARKYHHALNASVSGEWALCTAYYGQNDISVVLHRSGSRWTIVAHDGGAYGKDDLTKLGVPAADVAPLLKTYQ